MELIDKDILVKEINKRIKDYQKSLNSFDAKERADIAFQFMEIKETRIDELSEILDFVNTLEVKEVYEHNDSDLNSIIEEIGIEPDSKLAKMFKAAFYKSVDNYLTKKGEQLWKYQIDYIYHILYTIHFSIRYMTQMMTLKLNMSTKMPLLRRL